MLNSSGATTLVSMVPSSFFVFMGCGIPGEIEGDLLAYGLSSQCRRSGVENFKAELLPSGGFPKMMFFEKLHTKGIGKNTDHMLKKIR